MSEENIERLRDNINDIYEKLDELKEDVYDIKRENAETKVEMRILCRDVQSLTNAIKWGIGVLITCFGGFFMWAVQQTMLK